MLAAQSGEPPHYCSKGSHVKKLVASIAAALLALLFVSSVSGQNPPPPPPPPGGPSLSPPPAPGSAVTPTPTATAIPLTVTVKLAHGSLAPGKKQTVTATTLPAATVRITVRFPNGTSKTATGTAGASGVLAAWTFTQPPSVITRQSRTARVTASATSGTRVASATASYSIGFAPIDVSAQPRVQSRGRTMSIWVHSGARLHLVATIQLPNASGATVHFVTGSKGWKRIALSVRSSSHTGTGRVVVTGKVRGRAAQAATTFRIR